MILNGLPPKTRDQEGHAGALQVATTQQKLAAAAASCKAAEQAHAEEAAAAAALREQAAELQSKVLGQQEQVAMVSNVGVGLSVPRS